MSNRRPRVTDAARRTDLSPQLAWLLHHGAKVSKSASEAAGPKPAVERVLRAINEARPG